MMKVKMMMRICEKKLMMMIHEGEMMMRICEKKSMMVIHEGEMIK
jgi:hypothetical protein